MLCGARTPEQAIDNAGALHIALEGADAVQMKWDVDAIFLRFLKSSEKGRSRQVMLTAPAFDIDSRFANWNFTEYE